MNRCPTCGESFDTEVAFCPRDGAPLSPVRDKGDLVGRIIADRYRITSRVGGGGMGQVFKAEHIRMKRVCAVKVLHGALLSDPEAVKRFQREAENASQLSHPNVAQIYDFGEEGHVVYLAMEFIEGESLAGLLAREPALHPHVAADIISQSAAALEAAHLRGVLHRDVKPDNIMLATRPDGTYLVKLVDFGIARAMTGDTQKVTRTGLVIGTPEFMSPEQLAGEELDARSDLYALGLVAFQCLTGKDAFPNTSSKQNLILRLTSRPQSLADVRSDVPWSDALQRVFDRALAPDPDARHEHIGEFAEELAAAIDDMTPTQTAELYRKALEQRVVSVASRTPHGATRAESSRNTPPTPGKVSGAARDAAETMVSAAAPAQPAIQTSPTAAPSMPAGFQGTTPTIVSERASASSTRTAPRYRPPRRRPRVTPWLFVLVLGGWGYLVATDRTDEAKRWYNSAKSTVIDAFRAVGK